MCKAELLVLSSVPKSKERAGGKSRPRGIRDLPLPPVVDEPDLEPEDHVCKIPVKKEEGPKYRKPKYVQSITCCHYRNTVICRDHHHSFYLRRCCCLS